MKSRLVISGLCVEIRFDDGVRQGCSDNADNDVENTKENEVVGHPPREIRGQRAMNGFAVNHLKSSN